MRVPGLGGGWSEDPVWSYVYPWLVEHERASATASRLGVADQVTTMVADVGDLAFDGGTFDLVVSFTGLHCFPDPRRAVAEMVRVLAPGTRMGILGPMCASGEARSWLREAGCSQVDLSLHGALGYFRAVRGGVAR